MMLVREAIDGGRDKLPGNEEVAGFMYPVGEGRSATQFHSASLA